jgi:DNA helicase-2/ATP-dependent DNA helicase PcrA
MANIVDESVLDRELNPEQAAAAKNIKGPMLILAGAGSGKTRAITYKIAHLVSYHNVDPNRILAVTFTNKAAREMKSRIQNLLGHNLHFDWMGTFHSVCLRLLKISLNKEFVKRALGGSWFSDNFSIYDDDDQKRLIKEILKEKLVEVDASEVRRVHGAISRFKNTVLKKNGQLVLQTPDLVLNSASDNVVDTAQYYVEYQKRLREANAMDFDDLLFNAVLLLQKVPQLADHLKNHFDYVVVDEYQDTNDVQYELLKYFINDKRNVTVVGDDDQSIYGWRGANIEIIRSFHRDFAPVSIVKLERNYRSTSNIVKGAGSVIACNPRPKEMQKIVYSKEEAGEPIHVRNFIGNKNYEERYGRKVIPLEGMEANSIADTIAKAGPDFYSKTAVFYRTNAQSRVIEKALNEKGIPLVIFGGVRFWDRKEIRDILAYLRLLGNDKDDAAYKRVINTPPRKIGKTTVENIIERQRKGNGNFWENLLAESQGSGPSAARVKAFTDLILKWKGLVAAKEKSLPEIVESIINDICYKDFLRKDDENNAEERIANVDEMLNAIQEYDKNNKDVSLNDFLQYISLLTDADKKVDSGKGQVTLMTIHMAKGLEFNTVHIAGCDEGIFPLVRYTTMPTMSEIMKQQEEERRLFYVGCTRAEKKLYLYHVDGRFFQGASRYFGESHFLKEMDKTVVEESFCDVSGGTETKGLAYSGGPDGFNQDFSGTSGNIFHRPSRPGFGGSRGGFNRPSSVPDSVKKNDSRIVYRKPIKVEPPVKPSVPAAQSEHSDNPYHPGARVQHVKFGLGTILRCSGKGPEAHVEVRFSRDGSVRTLIARFLKIVG